MKYVPPVRAMPVPKSTPMKDRPYGNRRHYADAPKDQRLHLFLPADLLDTIAWLAERDGMSRQAMINELLDLSLRRQPPTGQVSEKVRISVDVHPNIGNAIRRSARESHHSMNVEALLRLRRLVELEQTKC